MIDALYIFKTSINVILYIYIYLLYKLLKISLFIGPKRPRGKSSNCHINWLARAGRYILVTFRADVLVPLSHSAAQLISFHCLTFFQKLYNYIIKQLMTFEALDMM